MNKRLYRLVFNRTRGQLMVVPEAARNHGKSSLSDFSTVTPGVDEAGFFNVVAARRALICALSSAFSFGLMAQSPAAAQVVADRHAPANQQAVVSTTANGVILVNVKTTSAAGVSRNVFSQFDVPKSGVILNNSRKNAHTLLGGGIQGNPWIRAGSARIILNEVNSSNPSQLNGYIEIAGTRAEMVLANPAGIQVDGGGFINVSHATLAGAGSVLVNGVPDGYRVRDGRVTVNGGGLDASTTDYTSLIGRSVQINGGVWAKQLAVNTGTNYLRRMGGTGTFTTDGVGASPVYAIDVSQLGGMYANKITLVGTEAGVGVRNAGKIGAAAGELIVNSDGRLANTGSMSASERLQLRAAGLTNGGAINAGIASIEVKDFFDNRGGSIEAGSLLLDSGGRIDNRAGKLLQSGGVSLDIKASALRNTSAGFIGTLPPATTSSANTNPAPSPAPQAQPAGHIWANNDIDNSSGQIATSGKISLTTASLDGSAGKIDVDTLTVNGGRFTNVNGTVNVRSDLIASVVNADNQGGVFAVGRDAVLRTANFSNAGGKFSVLGNLSLNLIGLNNRKGAIFAGGGFGLDATGSIDNDTGYLQGGSSFQLNAGGKLSNNDGAIESLDAAASLHVRANAIDNTTGRILNVGRGNTRIVSGSTITNSGLIGSNGEMDLSALTLLNRTGGMVMSDGGLTLGLSQMMTNMTGATISSKGGLTLRQDGAVVVNGGKILSDGKITLSSAKLDNGTGEIATYGGSGAEIAITNQHLRNEGGRITSDGDLSVSTHLLQSIGEISSSRDLGLTIDGDFTYGTQTRLHANRDFTLNVSGTFTNIGTLEVGRAVNLNTSQFQNIAGGIVRGQAVAIRASGNVTNDGAITGVTNVSVEADSIDNRKSMIGAEVSLKGRVINNAGATALIGAMQSLTISVPDQLANTGGATIYSGGRIAIGGNQSRGSDGLLSTRSGTVNNIGSTIEGAGNVEIAAVTINNVRENVLIDKVKTVDQTTHMSMPNWWRPGDNNARYDAGSSNFSAHEVYYFNPGDVLENTTYVTPDGQTIGRALVRTHANDTAFLSEGSGLNGAYGRQERIVLADGTKEIYYFASSTANNPDQVPDISSGVFPDESGLQNSTSELPTFSKSYGNCVANCLRLVTQPGYADPGGIIIRDSQLALAPRLDMLEIGRDAHHVVLEDQLRAGAGKVPEIRSGATMALSFENALNNHFGNIVSGGAMLFTGNGKSLVNNHGATLYATHQFDGTWTTSAGDTTYYQRPEMSQVIGTVGGRIVFGGSLSQVGVSLNNINATEGSVGNVRDAIHVIGSISGGSTGVGIGTSHPVAPSDIIGSGLGRRPRPGSTGPDQGTIVHGSSGGALAAGRNLGIPISNGTSRPVAPPPVIDIAPSPLATMNSTAHARYLFETLPEFSARGQATSSDYLFHALGVDPNLLQKRIGDGFYEQRMVRDQITELTGQSQRGSHSDDASYKGLLSNGIDFANRWQLQPGIALSAEQVRALTQDIVWMENQSVRLPDGSVQTVLAPRVYLSKLNSGAVRQNGALIAGNGISVEATDIINRGGLIDGRGSNGVGNTILVAKNDVINIGGALVGTNVLLRAGNDVRNESTTMVQRYQSTTASGAYTNLSNLGTIDAGGNLIVQAGRDFQDKGGKIRAGADASIFAARDAKWNELATGSSYHAQVNGSTTDNSSVAYQVGALSSGGSLEAQAGRDLGLKGAQLEIGINGNGNGLLTAGRDVTVGAVVNAINTDQHDSPGAKTYDQQVHLDETVVGTSIRSAGALSVRAGTDGAGVLAIKGSVVSASGAMALTASGNVDVLAVTERHVWDQAYHRESKNAVSSRSSTSTDHNARNVAIGSSVNGDCVCVTAGGDINVSGSEMAALQTLHLSAARDISVVSAGGTIEEKHSSTTKRSGFSFNATDGFGYSKASRNAQGSFAEATQSSSGLSGAKVIAVSGRDLLVQGSNVVADHDVALVAARDVNIVSARSSTTEASSTASKSSGMIGSKGQPAIGTVKASTSEIGSSTKEWGSQVASLGGDVNVQAGRSYLQTSSQLLAPTADISITGKSIRIDGLTDVSTSTEHSSYSKFALGGSVNVPVISSLQAVKGMADSVKATRNGRMKGLAAVTAAMQVNDAVAGVANVANTAKNREGIKVSASLGSSRSESQNVRTSSASVGSQVAAGGDVRISATGGGLDSNMTIIGSDIRGGANVVLTSDNAIALRAAQNTESQHSTNKSSGASVGVGFAFAGEQNGWTVELAANKGKGYSDGEGSTYANTHVNAGKTLTVRSGGNTSLLGAVVGGKTVVTDIGGDLRIESLQDHTTYSGKQTNVGLNVSLCIPPFCYGASTGTVNASKSKARGDFLSVNEQSGILAGDGGFQLAVGGNTSLVGGVIASSQVAVDQKLSKLATGTLTYRDLINKDTYAADGYGVSSTVSGKATGSDTLGEAQRTRQTGMAGGKPNATAGVGSSGGNQSSVTKSGISAGQLSIAKAEQQVPQGTDGSTLSRDVTSGNAIAHAGVLTRGWNGQELLQDVQAQVAITQAFSAQAPKAVAEFSDKKIERLIKAAAMAAPEERAVLLAEAARWQEGGAYRSTLHVISGALSGGLNGAIGAGTVAVSTDLLTDLQARIGVALERQGMSTEAAGVAAQGIAQLTSLGAGAIVGGTGGAAAALPADTNNRMLHVRDRLQFRRLAYFSNGRFTEEQIRDALRYSGLKDVNGNVIVPEGSRETFLSTDGNLSNIRTRQSYTDTLADDPDIKLLVPDGPVLMEIAPTRPSNELIDLIWEFTGGRKSPYVFTKTPSEGSAFLATPDGTTRGSVSLDGQQYFPLTVNCPAVSCTNSAPLAYIYAESDRPTKDYLDALDTKFERDMQLLSLPMELGTATFSALRNFGTLRRYYNSSDVGASVSFQLTGDASEQNLISTRVFGDLIDEQPRRLSYSSDAQASRLQLGYSTDDIRVEAAAGGYSGYGLSPTKITYSNVGENGRQTLLGELESLEHSKFGGPSHGNISGAIDIARGLPNSVVGEAHNATNFARYIDGLATTEAANPLVESLQATGQLPENYLTKQQAIQAGWRPGKALENSVPGGQIGGDIFENSTSILPSIPGRVWYEADIGQYGVVRRANRRLLYSNDGLLYVTSDHYKTVLPIGTWR